MHSKAKSKPQIALFGCGKKGRCGLSHNTSSFLTIDSNAKVEPDLYTTIEMGNSVDHVLEPYNISAYVFERFPIIDYVANNIVYAAKPVCLVSGGTPDFLKRINRLYSENKQGRQNTDKNYPPAKKIFCYKPKTGDIQSEIIFIAEDKFDPKKFIEENPEFKSYMASCNKYEDSRVWVEFSFEETVLENKLEDHLREKNPQTRKLMHQLDDSIALIEYISFIKEVNACILEEKSSFKLTYDDINKLVESYTPGSVRRMRGDTRGIKELKDFLKGKKLSDTIIDNDCSLLVDILSNRHKKFAYDTLSFYFNPVHGRSMTGETGRIHIEIAKLLIKKNALKFSAPSKAPARRPTQT